MQRTVDSKSYVYIFEVGNIRHKCFWVQLYLQTFGCDCNTIIPNEEYINLVY